MSELLDRIALVKAKWTMPELVEQLLGEEVPSSRKVHSPFNDADNSPSCHIYDDSFYCYSTGNYGDVVDLVRLLKRCTVERAVQILEEEADDLGLVATVRTVAPKPVFVLPHLRYQAVGDQPVTALTGVAPWVLRQLFNECRIAFFDHPGIAILHHDPTSVDYMSGRQHEVIGIKYRNPNGKKTSEPGSDFSSFLYQPFEYTQEASTLRVDSFKTLVGPLEPTFCVITEGETDSWAWLSARPHDHVFSLPSGAQSWKDRFLEQIAGYDKVYIAMDNDESGLRARDRITSAVGWGRAEHVQIPGSFNDVREGIAAGWTPKVG